MLFLPFAQAQASKSALNRDAVLARTYPNCEFKRNPITLTSDQRKEIKSMTGTEQRSPIVFSYDAVKDGNVVGTVFFDTHKVRTLPEILLVAIKADGKIHRVEIIDFKEPHEYLPDAAWLAQFEGKETDQSLQLHRGIHAITGCTLSARAASDSVRRMRIIHGFRAE